MKKGIYLKKRLLALGLAGVVGSTAASYGGVNVQATELTEETISEDMDMVEGSTENIEESEIVADSDSLLTCSEIKLVDKIVCTDGSGDTYEIKNNRLDADYIVSGTSYTFSENPGLSKIGVHATKSKISGKANGKNIEIVFNYEVSRELYNELTRGGYNGGGGRMNPTSWVGGYEVYIKDQNGKSISNAKVVQTYISYEDDKTKVMQSDKVGAKGYASVAYRLLYAIDRVEAYVPIEKSVKRDSEGNGLNYVNRELKTYSDDPLKIYDEDGLLVATVKPKAQVLNTYGSASIYDYKGENTGVAGAPILNTCYDIVYADSNCKINARKNLCYTGIDSFDNAQFDVVIDHRTRNFCKRLYTKCLGRSADLPGVTYWEKQLNNKTMTGADVGRNFVFSAEYKSKKTSDEAFLNMLYEVFMGRSADKDGFNYWLDLLKQGVSREYVYKGFAESREYTEICKSYGIERGNVSLSQARDKNINLTRYVNRIYEKAMARKGEEGGLNYWCTQIQSKAMSPVAVAEQFILSKEFSEKELNNTEYVNVLYRTFMGRESDQSGLDYWVERLNEGESRKSVLKAFAGCPEFQGIIKSFGL